MPETEHPVAPDVSRRTFVKGLACGGALAVLDRTLQAAPIDPIAVQRPSVLTGTTFELRASEALVNMTGAPRVAHTLNGMLPAPTLRWREGETVTIRVTNALRDHQASIHWHGIVLPANMDGVPGLSFDGIEPGETFTYRIPVRQAGTYWYHSHSAFQEQVGLYGPLIVEPREPEPFAYDREHVVMLTDWTDERPETVFRKLKKRSDYYNFRQRTVLDFFRDVGRLGLGGTLRERHAWGVMRMTPTDLADVTGNTYTHLMNGLPPAANWTGLFAPGERVRLRLINGSAMTYFDVRIPGLKMTVVAADGQYVRPVQVDELRIAVAETFDVIVEPAGQDAYTIFAQAMDRTAYARGTLAVREGLAPPVPALDPRPLLSMADMGHGNHAGHGDHGAHAAEGHAGHATGESGLVVHPATERRNPLVDMQTSAPSAKLDDPGIGLRDNGRRVLTYADLHSLFDDPDPRAPSRTIELHLTGHMERFAWSFDGVKYGQASPIRLKYGERVRLVLVNDSMMTHPIHLHGMWSDLEGEDGAFQVRKHTLDMPPGSRRTMRVTADALGRWAFHCHLLYHMEAGMFREVRVEE
ncbi:MAG: copper resistance system multicopper oxidase [Vicinamibacterales bacterium]